MDVCAEGFAINRHSEATTECRPPGISLILPAYNEQETIRQAIQEANKSIGAITSDYEILIVDDGSTDATADIALQLTQLHPAIRVLRQPGNMGYGAALRRGFEESTMPLVAFTDSDCQFDLRELDRLIMLSRHYDIVCGYRIDRQDPWHRKLYSRIYNLVVRLLLGTGVRDCDCAMKLFRRDVVKSTRIESDGFFVNAELLAKARLDDRSIVEVGVTHRPRAAGSSSVSFRHAIPVGASLLRFWWRTILFPSEGTGEQHHSNNWSGPFRFGAFSLLMMMSFLILFTRLSYPLVEPDETRYAQIALEMLESNDWVTPTLDGEPYLDKPPLLYWMTAASYSLFGVSETAARLPCAAAALLTILAVYGLGKRLVGDRAAWIGAVALLLCSGFVVSGRFLMMDGPLTLFTTLSLLTAFLACAGHRFRWDLWLAAGFSCGLGVLTKGPIAILLVVPPLVVSRWLAGDVQRLRPRHCLAFAVSIVATTFPWFIAISAIHKGFVEHFIWQHHVLRFASAFIHQEPWWFYLPVVLTGMFPTSVLSLPLTLFLFGRSRDERLHRTRTHGFLLLSAVWGMGFFSLSSCKLPSYILPILPPLCLLLGSMLDLTEFTVSAQTRLARILKRIPQSTTLTILAIGAMGATLDAIVPTDGGFGTLVDVAVALGSVTLLIIIWRRGNSHPHVAWCRLVAVAVAVMMFAMSDFLPELSRLRSIHSTAVDQRHMNQSTPIAYFGHDTYAASFHLKPHEIIRFRVNEHAVLKDFVSRHERVIIVTEPHLVDSIRATLGNAVSISLAGGHGHVFLAHSNSSTARHVSESDDGVIR